MKRATSCIVVILILAGLAWCGAYFDSPGHPSPDTFTVAPGDSVDKIVSGLHEKGFIRSEILFKVALRSSGLATKLQPGDYRLGAVESYGDVIATLASGGVSADEFVLKVLEGHDLRDIVEALQKAGYARADELYQVTGIPATDHRTLSSNSAPKPDDFSKEFPFLKEKPDYVSLEGFLFPDTYRVFKDATPTEIVHLMLENFEKKTVDVQREAAEAHKSVYAVVTMASVIENEVRGDDDRRIVSDLFWRRLKEGMPMQADSTVNYITRKGHAAVLLEDTKNISEYNTYKYPGLPLGPIGNPGISALRAAVDPEPNPYVYFLTDEEGAVHYGRTLSEHNANKAKYLR